MSLLEWRASQELRVSTATQIANLAYRRGAFQLLTQCVHFLSVHLVCVQSTGYLADIEPAVSDLVLDLNEKSQAPQSRAMPALLTRGKRRQVTVVLGSQSESALPTYNKQIPYMAGHTAVVGDGGHMFVLGGVNRHQYTSLKHVLVSNRCAMRMQRGVAVSSCVTVCAYCVGFHRRMTLFQACGQNWQALAHRLISASTTVLQD